MSIHAFVHRWIAKRCDRPHDIAIGPPDDIYMLRWFVIPRNRWFNVYLHYFMRSDDDRALHDHPWWNVSYLLAGEYTEHTINAGGINVRTVRRAGEFKLRRATHAHRIELHAGPCWSLFLTGPRLRSWGFHCPQGWRHWRKFTTGEHGETVGAGCGEDEEIRS